MLEIDIKTNLSNQFTNNHNNIFILFSNGDFIDVVVKQCSVWNIVAHVLPLLGIMAPLNGIPMVFYRVLSAPWQSLCNLCPLACFQLPYELQSVLCPPLHSMPLSILVK